MSEWRGLERRNRIKRRVRRVYGFMDRRSGFDRRKRHPILGTLRDNPKVLISVLVAVNVLSLVDGFFTAAELGLGIATEGNPVLNAAVRQHPLLAVAVKVGALLLVSAGIWYGRNNRAILSLAPLALVLFMAVVAYHAGTLRGMGLL